MQFNYGPPRPGQPNLYPNVHALNNPSAPGQPSYQPGAPQYQPGGPQYQQAPMQYQQVAPQYQGAPQFQPGAPQQQPGFGYPYQPGPAAMSYPNVTPVAPSAPNAPAPGFAYPGYPHITPTPVGGQTIEWVPTTPNNAHTLSDRAVVGGFEGHDGSPLWVIRARFEGDLIPGKLAIKHKAAYVPWGGNENAVRDIEVMCARPDKIRWVSNQGDAIPNNAIAAGNTSCGEPLYIGRAREQGSLTPGKVHPSHKAMYISFAGKEVAHKSYDILCSV